MRANFKETAAISRELMAIAEEEHDSSLLSEAHLLEGMSRGWTIAFPAALRHYDKAVAFAEATPQGHVDFRVGPHPAVVAHVVQGLTQWLAGSPEAGWATMRHALQLAADLDHPYSMAYALHHAGLLDLWVEDSVSLGARADEMGTIAAAHNYPVWQALSLVLGGVSKVMLGEIEAGLERVEEGFEQYKGLSTPPVFWPNLLAIRATAFGAAGRVNLALAAIQEAEAALQPGDPQASYVGVVHARLLLAVQPPDLSAPAETFERVVQSAHAHGAKMSQIQALTRLVALRRGTPKEDESRRALRDLYDSFTEGFDMPHLVAARAALDT
jgi:hypothetical protein